MAVASYFFIHNYPSTATFLSPSERSLILNRLSLDSDAIQAEPFKWAGVRAALLDYKCILYGLAFHTMSLPLYTLSLFFPTIIKGLGYTNSDAQLLTIPPYAFATILTVIVAIASEKTKRRAPFIMASSAFAIIGYVILLANNPHRPGVSYLGTFFAAGGIYPGTAIVLSWAAANVSGQTKRATATAMTIMIGNLGAVLGTQLYRPGTAPRYFLGHGFALGYLVANLLVTGVLWYSLKRENKVKRAKREILQREGRVAERGEGMQGDEDLGWEFQY